MTIANSNGHAHSNGHAPTARSNGQRTPGHPLAEYADKRLGTYKVGPLLRKVFPEHWSFMFGEMALYSFIVLILTGIYLTMFFKPSMNEVVYHGHYVPLQGIRMSEAYESTVHISFDVRGGLLIRQIHHWAAIFMSMSVTVHLLRHFFTGSFRKPREINWMIGFVLLTLVIIEGFAGYSLPDDLLSGTGLRIAEGVVLAMPIVGTYLQQFMFGGEFPGNDFIPRLFTIHILLIPGIMLALVVVHVLLVGVHKHTQFRGPGKTEENVIGLPLMPVYMAKAGGFFFMVFGLLALLGALAQINPVWAFGPYRPDQISAGSQPDWYMGFLEGSLRIFPGWEIAAWGHTVTLSVLIPAVILPGVLATIIVTWPFLEAWVTEDRGEHHLLDRPRDHPVRTAFGFAWCTFYMVLWLAGGNDILANKLHLSLNEITWGARVMIFLGPAIAYVVAKRICLGLLRAEREKVLHGRESGVIKRLPHGEFVEVHEPLDPEQSWALMSREDRRPLPMAEEEDANGIPNPSRRTAKLRVRMSSWMYGGHAQVEKPTSTEVVKAGSHSHE
jgi:ubiquinol-cytochrome c reductase cytochrome b subunit